MNQTSFNRRHLLGLGTASLGALALSRAANAQDKTKAAATPDAKAATPNAKADMMTGADTLPVPAMQAPAMTASAADIGILTSALGIEQIQAAFYSQVLGAHQKRAYLGEKALAAVTTMASHEAAHVQTITDALTALQADVPTAPTFKFPYTAFVSPIGMSWLGYSLEEIAIGAHLDSLERLQSRPLRQTVATIMGADSAQAAMLRTLSGFGFSPRYFEAKLSPTQVESLLAVYRS